MTMTTTKLLGWNLLPTFAVCKIRIKNPAYIFALWNRVHVTHESVKSLHARPAAWTLLYRLYRTKMCFAVDDRTVISKICFK